MTRTPEELSIVCPETAVPHGVAKESPWSLIKLHGPFPLSAIGVLASVAVSLAAAGVSILVISTFDTDYILVRRSDERTAVRALVAAGHTVAS